MTSVERRHWPRDPRYLAGEDGTVVGPSGRVRPSRDMVTWAGCAVVGGAAAVMSFTALSDLARRMGITGTVEVFGWTFHVAWLLPIVVDILAAVATRVWLRRLGGWEAVRFARRAAWGAIAATVGGNAYHGYLTGHGDVDVVIVAAVPAVVFGTIVHLGMLIGSPESVPPRGAPLAGRTRSVVAASCPGLGVTWRSLSHWGGRGTTCGYARKYASRYTGRRPALGAVAHPAGRGGG